jgi:uncharacterized protein YciI
MAWFLVEIRYVQEKYLEARPRHREFLDKQAADGTVLVAGPLTDETGGVSLYQAEDEAALYEIINQDPYYLEGAVAERTVRGFRPMRGAWVA